MFFVGFIIVFFVYISSGNKAPNILFILVDDLGWNDISFHNGSDYKTPNIDKMAHESLILNQYYIQHICSPTRSALLSGLYPIHTGLQDGVIRPSWPYGLPLNLTILPQDLKKIGYKTHAIGKWHIGFFAEEYVPTSRGFDTYFGYYLGAEDYYFHNRSWEGDDGFDLRNNTEPIRMDGEYSTWLFANETLKYLKQYHENNQSNPFFIYLPFQAIHSPLEAPQNVIDSYDYIANTDRRKTAAMMKVLDDSLGEIFDILKNNYTEIWDNLYIIWSTDNGGPVQDQHNNWPLRGSKGTLWEGGVRGAGFIGGGLLNNNRRGQISNQLMHITDWYPTICSMAGIQPTNKSIQDGYDMLDTIQNNLISPRKEILHNIDPVDCNSTIYPICGGIRMNLTSGDFKLIIGKEVTGNDSDWSTLSDMNYTNTIPTVNCNGLPPIINFTQCPYNGKACLYKIDNDPCEYYDIKSQYPNEYNTLYNKLLYYNKTMVIPLNMIYSDDKNGSNPNNFGGFWSPWKNITSKYEL